MTSRTRTRRPGARRKRAEGRADHTDEIVKGVPAARAPPPRGRHALTREQGEVIDAYYSMLKQRLKVAFEQPPGPERHSGGLCQGAERGRWQPVRRPDHKSSGSAEFDQAVLAAVSRTRMPERPDHKSEVVTFPFTMREKDEG